MSTTSGYDGILIGNGDAYQVKEIKQTGMAVPQVTELGFAAFVAEVKADLWHINSRPIGKDLLRLIGLRYRGTGTTAGHKVVIVPDLCYLVGPSDLCYLASRSGVPNAETRASTDGRRRGNFGDHIRLAGKGSSAIVRYINRALDNEIGVKNHIIIRLPNPPFVVLAHELIHAFHYVSGNNYPDSVDGVKREELYTTGVGPYQNTRISENAIRKEHGLPERTCYYSPLSDAKIGGVNCAWLSQSVGGSPSRDASGLREAMGTH
jgi:hypothetical protein